jgi:hypothetical protein
MNPQLEAEWRTAQHPTKLIQLSDQLCPRRNRRELARKWRLFAVHCCQHLHPLLTREAVRQALRTAEAYADDLASPEELRAGWLAVRQAHNGAPLGSRWEHALTAVLHTATPELRAHDVQLVAQTSAVAQNFDWVYLDQMDLNRLANLERPQEMQRQCVIVRDLFCVPPPTIEPAWLRWEDGQIPRLAQAIYQEGRFEAMPILADALEEAGCDDPVLLDHARLPGEHFKGCWLLDALRGVG